MTRLQLKINGQGNGDLTKHSSKNTKISMLMSKEIHLPSDDIYYKRKGHMEDHKDLLR